MIELVHGRVVLALHELGGGGAHEQGPALLLLHGLGGSSADWEEHAAALALWPGPVRALDFAGHGESGRVRGGAYYAELLLGDADAALAHLGRAAVAGAGLGAYIALLLAGARPDAVTGTLLLPGAGLAGGGALPDFENVEHRRLTPDDESAERLEAAGCDPRLSVLERDIRPVDYAESFAARARRLLFVEDGTPRPPWWEVARKSAAAEGAPAELGEALRRLASP